MRVNQAERLEDARVLQELEAENAWHKKLVADQALDISVLGEAASGSF